jgi:ATP-dependent protease ClpP protease subunit
MRRRIANYAGSHDPARPWYRVIRDATGGTASTPTRVDVYDDIGGGGMFGLSGITAADFTADLAAISGDLEVHINSAGGDVFDGIAIFNTLAARSGNVVTVVDGIAASIASVIAQAGRTRVIAPGAMMMIHDGLAGCLGNEADMLDMAKTLGLVSDNLAGIYALRGTTSKDTWRAAMRAETWYTAKDAVAAGLADQLAERPATREQVTAHDLSMYAKVPDWLRAAATRPYVEPDEPRHMPMTGTHTHDHAAMGAGDHDDGMHSHAHTHSGDALHSHDHQVVGWDPDGDGDDDSSAAGDTDHSHWAPDGTQLRSVPGRPMPATTTTTDTTPTGSYDSVVEAVNRAEFWGAAVDTSTWDGGAAMSAAAASGDPAAAYKAICAGRKEGDPAKQASWALPHHKHPGDAPNAGGVRNALARLPQTQGLTNEAAARAHLEAHMKAVHPDGGGSGGKSGDTLDLPLLNQHDDQQDGLIDLKGWLA